MSQVPMIHSHQTPAAGAWPLAQHQAATLAPSAVPRCLRVEDGSLWVTAAEAGPQGDDLWLRAGDSLALPPGSAWVVQAWPQARVAVLEAAPPLSRGAASSRAWWRALAPSLAPLPGVSTSA